MVPAEARLPRSCCRVARWPFHSGHSAARDIRARASCLEEEKNADMYRIPCISPMLQHATAATMDASCMQLSIEGERLLKAQQYKVNRATTRPHDTLTPAPHAHARTHARTQHDTRVQRSQTVHHGSASTCRHVPSVPRAHSCQTSRVGPLAVNEPAPGRRV